MNPLAWQHRDLVQGLHSLQPKKRGNPVSWIILMGCTYVVGGLGFDASVREAVFSPGAPHNVAAFTQATAPKLPSAVGAALPNALVALPAPQAVAQQVAPQPAAAPANQDDSPLPHAKAHNQARTQREHSVKHHTK